jgi:hypothetical protein
MNPAIADGVMNCPRAPRRLGWIVCYGLASYSFGEAFANVASPAAVVLGLTAALIVLAVPALILRYEKRLLAKADLSRSGNPFTRE